MTIPEINRLRRGFELVQEEKQKQSGQSSRGTMPRKSDYAALQQFKQEHGIS